MLDKKSKRALLLLSATTAYLVFGSLTFSAFEYDEDMQLREEIRETREAMQEKYNFTQQDFEELEQVVVASIPFKAGYQWQFAGAFYFCAVVLTTIGYGHSTPATTAGKLFCMVFALVGIPLGLVTFQSTGERVNTFVRYCLVKLRDALARRGIFILKEVKARHLLVVSSSVGGVMILVGTIVFHTNEHWSMFDALYYCVITLLCIGFGDLVPLQTDNRLQQDTAYVLFALFFILFGLAIFSACVNLLVLEFMARNADIVTARGRLRRFASSLRRTTSFRRSFRRNDSRYLNARSLSRAQRLVVAEKNGKAAHVEAHEKAMAHHDGVQASNEKSKEAQLTQEIYDYYRVKPTDFAVRRLPSKFDTFHSVSTVTWRMSPRLLVVLVLLMEYTVFGHNVRLRRSPLSSEKCLSHDDCPLKCRPYCDCQVDHRNCSDQTGHCIGGIPCNSDEECRKKCDHDHNYRCFEGVCS